MTYEEMLAQIEAMIAENPEYKYLFLNTMVVTALVICAFALVIYILQAIAVRRLSITAGLSHAWMAFVPVLASHQLGKLAELKLPGEKADRKCLAYSIHMPVLSVLSFLLQGVYSFLYFWYGVPGMEEVTTITPELGLLNGIAVGTNVVGIIATVISIMALFRIFVLTGARSAGMLSLLVVLIPLCQPFLLFAFRKNQIAPQPLDGEQDGDDPDRGFHYDNK